MISSIPPDRILQSILSTWNIPESIKDRLDKYYLHKWDVEYFKVFMRSGTVVHQGIEYHIIYHDCLPVHLDSAKQVMLSFRKMPSMVYGYVLVKPGV